MQGISWLAEKLAVYQELCLMQLVTLLVLMVKSRFSTLNKGACSSRMSAAYVRQAAGCYIPKGSAHLKLFTTKRGSNWSHTNIYVTKHTGCGLTRTQHISNYYWLVWRRWPMSEKLLMIAGKWKCILHFSLERKTIKNVNSAVVNNHGLSASQFHYTKWHTVAFTLDEKSWLGNNSTSTVTWKRMKPTHSQWKCD
jgi:hypothetical protein